MTKAEKAKFGVSWAMRDNGTRHLVFDSKEQESRFWNWDRLADREIAERMNLIFDDNPSKCAKRPSARR